MGRKLKVRIETAGIANEEVARLIREIARPIEDGRVRGNMELDGRPVGAWGFDKLAATIALHPRPLFLVSGEGSVWVVNQGDGTVQRIDGKTGELLATIEAQAGGSGGDIAVGGGYVWVTTQSHPLIQIDPHANALKGIFKRPSGVYIGDAIRYGANSVWISGPSVYRIKPPQ